MRQFIDSTAIGNIGRPGHPTQAEVDNSVRSLAKIIEAASADVQELIATSLAGGGVPSWVPRDANGLPFTFFADFVASRFWAGDAVRADYAAWLLALGGTDGADPQFTFPWGGATGTYLIEGVTPTTSGNNNFFQIDDGTNNNVRAVRRLTQAVSETVVRTASAQVNAIGQNVAARIPFRVASSLALNNYIGSLNGAAAVTDTSALIPVVTTFRAGNNADDTRPVGTGEIWKIGGTLTASDAAKIQALATPMYDYVLGGDSYAATSGGIGLLTSLVTRSKKFVANTSTGGNTLEMAVAALEASTVDASVRRLLWDGSNNSADTLENDMARYQRAIDENTYIATPAFLNAQDGPTNAAAKAIAPAMLAQWPGRVVNSYAIAEALAPGTSGNVATSLLQGDGIHPDTAWANAVADALMALAA